MRFSPLSVVLIALLPAAFPHTAEAVMVDFEPPYYTAATSFDGVDGWEVIDIMVGSAVVTPDPGGSGDTTVLAGAQSGRISGADSGGGVGLARLFDSGPYHLANGTVVSGHMQLDQAPGGSVEFFYSHAPFTAATPAGIAGRVGGNFHVFGDNGSSIAFFDSGVPSFSGVDYLMEIELDLDSQSFQAYATNVSAGGTRVLLGNLSLAVASTITPEMYSGSGYVLAARNYAVGVYDDFDIEGTVVAPVGDMLPGRVSFELPAYVRGASVLGKDGWWKASGSGNAVVINTPDVLENSQSMLVTSSVQDILQRNFGPLETYEDGSIVSTRMMLMDSAAGDGESGFYFSNDQLGQVTPAGIIGDEGGNFWIYGLDGGTYDDYDKGLDTGIPFSTGADYLLEMQLDLTGGQFYSYATNLTEAGPRTLLGAAEFRVGQGETVEPGDNSNSGYVLKVLNHAEVVFDELDLEPGSLTVNTSTAGQASIPEPSLTVYLLSLLIGLR